MSQGCRSFETVPRGYKIWRGAVPALLTQFAINSLHQATRQHPYPYGQIVAKTTYSDQQVSDQTVYAWASSHSWSTRNGQIVQGCYDGISLLVDDPNNVSGPPDNIGTPDPNAAVFSEPPGIDWLTVGLSALAGAAVVGGFLFVTKTSPHKKAARALERMR